MDQETKFMTIYLHTFPDRSVYIGVTSQKNLNVRWGYNGCGYDNQEQVRAQIEFWGWGLVKHEVLEQGEMTKEEAYKKECDYTLKYVENGYKVLNRHNTCNPCRYRIKESEPVYVYYDETTGKEYGSLRDAAAAVGVSHEAIRLSIVEDRKLRNGHKFIKKIKEINILMEEEVR